MISELGCYRSVEYFVWWGNFIRVSTFTDNKKFNEFACLMFRAIINYSYLPNIYNQSEEVFEKKKYFTLKRKQSSPLVYVVLNILETQGQLEKFPKIRY